MKREIKEGWEIKKLEELARLYQPQTISAKDFTDYGFPVYGANGVVGNFHSLNHDSWQVTVTCRGSTCGTVNRTVDRCWITGNSMVLNCDQNSNLDKLFFYYLLSAQDLTGCITGTGQPQIVRSPLSSFSVEVPSSLSEQIAIASVLSDVDALLDSLDRLIAKKRDLKQAVMQQLLIGQTRLPGFSGEWVTKRLGDTAILKARIGWQGLTTAEYRNTGDFLLVTGTEFSKGYVDWDSCHFVEEFRYKQDVNIQLRPRDVLVTKDGTIGKVALVSNLPSPATLNSGVFVIRPLREAFVPEYFYFILRSQQFSVFLSQLAAGSTISHLYQKDFVTFMYRLPSNLEEQIAIAKVLTEMDLELVTLEQRRNKTAALKLGMMQELLTGRTRLVSLKVAA